jgi:DHA1 family bicyclomycin/chloramphenicol resistance-like MFS transporter
MGVGAVCTALVGTGSDPTLTVALVLVCAGVIGQAAFWIALHNRNAA